MNLIKYTFFFFVGIFILSTIFQVLSEYSWVLILLLVTYLSYIGIKSFLKSDDNEDLPLLEFFQNQIRSNNKTIATLKNENSSLKNYNNYLKQQLENQKQNTQHIENKYERPFQNIIKIPDRRPFDPKSFQLEKDIALVLSHKEDKEGKTLVNLVIKIIQKMGYHAVNNDGYNDKGKDILVYKNENNKEPFMAIQCKSYSPQTNQERIRRITVSDFNGNIADNFQKTNRIFITSSYFSENAIKDFQDKVTLIDRIELIQLLLHFFPKETINVLNSNSLYKIKDVCKTCGHGRLQYIQHKQNDKNTNAGFCCTNCQYNYDKKTNKYTPPKYK
ncbi:restriction endonuclease [Streptococcus pluranimalium]